MIPDMTTGSEKCWLNFSDHSSQNNLHCVNASKRKLRKRRLNKDRIIELAPIAVQPALEQLSAKKDD
jgi:hypothetical protein